MIQSSYWFGCLVGVFLIPFLAEIVGRRKSILFATVLILIAMLINFLGISIDNTVLSVIGNAGMGCASNGFVNLNYTYLAEICN